jgi:lipopolysaccharide transport system ATP-binding protein
MQDVSKNDGRTVLFVSHNMASVKSLCTRGVVLENGQLVFEGETDLAVKKYLSIGANEENTNFKQFTPSPATSSPLVDIISIGVKAKGKKFSDPIAMDDEVIFEITFNKKTTNARIDTTFLIKDNQGNYLIETGSGRVLESNKHKTGISTNVLSIPKNFFNQGQFFVNLLMVENRKRVTLAYNDILMFEILPKQFEIGTHMGQTLTPLSIEFNWYNQ